MERFNHNEQSTEIVLTPEDVESAIREFLCNQYPEFRHDWILNPKYNIGTVIFSGTKE